MNKKGVIAFTVLMAVLYFIAGMYLYQFLKPVIDEQRNASFLDCSSPDTDGDRVSCLLIDAVIPLVVIGILSTTGGIITERVLFK